MSAGYAQFLSATFGPKDVTQLLQTTYDGVCASAGSTVVNWMIPCNNTFWFEDPHPDLKYMTTIVYRYKVASPTVQGALVWSNFKALTCPEGGQVRMDSYSDTTPGTEPAPSAGRFVVRAFWWDADVTARVQSQLDSAAFTPGVGPQVDVSTNGLGGDPAFGTVKNCSITYGTFIGQWTYDVLVGMNAAPQYYLQMPPLFPPPRRPHVRDEVTFVTFKNSSTGLDLYPRVYTEDGLVFWDGQAAGSVIHPGASRDVSLCAKAGCVEGNTYYLGFVTNIGGNSTLAFDFSFLAIAVSSAQGEPLLLTWASGADNKFTISHDFLPQTTQCQYYAEDLRLNIYSATWGTTDYTSFVRQHYVSQTIQTPPTATANNYSIPASNTVLNDPLRNVPKALVIIYRLAYQIGNSRGAIFNPLDPPVFDPRYTSENIQPTYTDQYPILQDVGQFRSAGTLEGANPISINLLTQDTSPASIPTDSSLFTARAVHATADVTTALAPKMATEWAKPTTADITLSGAYADFGGDPWPDHNKNFTLLLGYPIVGSGGGPGRYQYRTVIGYDMNSVSLTIPRNPPALPSTPAVLAPFVPHEVPTYNLVSFRNLTPLTVWPEVCVASRTVWDGRKVAGDWLMGSGQSKTLRLIDDASCQEGSCYNVTFDCASYTMPPADMWVCASKSPKYSMTISYVPRALSAPTEFDIIKETVAVA